MKPIPILMYHNIDHAPQKKSRGLYVRPGQFARQMAVLKAAGFRGLSMSELMPYLRGEQQGKVCGITFDDGYLDNLENAMPVLQQHNFSATCYVVSQRMGEYNR